MHSLLRLLADSGSNNLSEKKEKQKKKVSRDANPEFNEINLSSGKKRRCAATNNPDDWEAKQA